MFIHVKITGEECYPIEMQSIVNKISPGLANTKVIDDCIDKAWIYTYSHK